MTRHSRTLAYFAMTAVAAGCASSPPAKTSAPPSAGESMSPAPPPPPAPGITPTAGAVPENDKAGTGSGTSTATPTNPPGTPQPKPPVNPSTMPSDPLPTDLGAAQASFDKSAQSFSVAGNDCQQLCKALASMQNAADHLCDLTKSGGGGEKKRCTDAQGRVTSAKERVKQTCGGCGP